MLFGVMAARIDQACREKLTTCSIEDHMRVHFCGLVLAIVLGPQTGSATDIGYQLPTDDLAAVDATQPVKPFEIAFVNRTWATPGIEQAERELLRPRKFDARKLKSFRIEVVEGR